MKWGTLQLNRNFSKIMTLISSVLEKSIDPTHLKAIVRTLDL